MQVQVNDENALATYANFCRVTGTPEDELALPRSEPVPLPFSGIARRVAPTYLAWLRRKDRTEVRID